MKTVDEIMELVTQYGATCVGYEEGFETGFDLDISEAALRTVIEALVKDAERYRWMRLNSNPAFHTYYAGVLDAHIDAAMTEVKS